MEFVFGLDELGHIIFFCGSWQVEARYYDVVFDRKQFVGIMY